MTTGSTSESAMHVSRPVRSRRAAAPAILGATLLGAALVLHPVGALADASTDPVGDDVCAGHLLTVDPTSVTGDPTAVAITAQRLDAEQPGWVDVSWEAAPDGAIATVLTTGVDGEVTVMDGGPAGRATSVTSLTFCGPAAASASSTTPTEARR